MTESIDPGFAMIPKTELDDARKEFELQRQVYMKSAEDAHIKVLKSTQENHTAELEKVAGIHNALVESSNKRISARGVIAVALFILLLISATVNIIMVINNIGGLK